MYLLLYKSLKVALDLIVPVLSLHTLYHNRRRIYFILCLS